MTALTLCLSRSSHNRGIFRMRRDGRGTHSLGAYHTLDPLSPSWSPPRHPGHTTPNRPGAGGHEHCARRPPESSLLISLLPHLRDLLKVRVRSIQLHTSQFAVFSLLVAFSSDSSSRAGSASLRLEAEVNTNHHGLFTRKPWSLDENPSSVAQSSQPRKAVVPLLLSSLK